MSRDPRYQYPSHLRPALNKEERQNTIAQCLELAKQYDFDTFAFSGTSGAAVGFVLAHLLNKEVIVVRKPNEPRRAGIAYEVEGYRHSVRYMIVDDLISTGTTAGRIVHGVRRIAPTAEPIGILTYNSMRVVNQDRNPSIWTDVMDCAAAAEVASAKLVEQTTIYSAAKIYYSPVAIEAMKIMLNGGSDDSVDSLKDVPSSASDLPCVSAGH